METIKEIAQWVWMDCKNRHRLYPDNNHTFADWWATAAPTFEKFTLLKETPTIATDNTLPPSSPTATAEEKQTHDPELCGCEGDAEYCPNNPASEYYVKPVAGAAYEDKGQTAEDVLMKYFFYSGDWRERYEVKTIEAMTEFASLKEQEAQATIKELREELARWESGERNTEQ